MDITTQITPPIYELPLSSGCHHKVFINICKALNSIGLVYLRYTKLTCSRSIKECYMMRFRKLVFSITELALWNNNSFQDSYESYLVLV